MQRLQTSSDHTNRAVSNSGQTLKQSGNLAGLDDEYFGHQTKIDHNMHTERTAKTPQLSSFHVVQPTVMPVVNTATIAGTGTNNSSHSGTQRTSVFCSSRRRTLLSYSQEGSKEADGDTIVNNPDNISKESPTKLNEATRFNARA